LRYRKEYPEFDQKVDQVEAEFIEFHMAALMKHAREGNSGASMFSLERRFPEFFAKPETSIQIAQINAEANKLDATAMWLQNSQPAELAGRPALDDIEFTDCELDGQQHVRIV
jgi:hypothetical protein